MNNPQPNTDEVISVDGDGTAIIEKDSNLIFGKYQKVLKHFHEIDERMNIRGLEFRPHASKKPVFDFLNTLTLDELNKLKGRDPSDEILNEYLITRK